MFFDRQTICMHLANNANIFEFINVIYVQNTLVRFGSVQLNRLRFCTTKKVRVRLKSDDDLIHLR